MAAAEVKCFKKYAISGDLAVGNSRRQALIKKRFDKELVKLELRQKLHEKLDKLKNKEEPKPVTEEDKVKSIIKDAWSQTGCMERSKKLKAINKKEISCPHEEGGTKSEKLELKFTAHEEKEIINYALNLVQNSNSVSLRTIRSEMYKFGTMNDIHDIFKKANKNENKNKNWLYNFLKIKLKPETETVAL